MSEGVAIPAGLPHTPCVLRAWRYANAVSARYYGCPVYLVGGALADPDPRDIDIVIPIPDPLFCSMYADGDPTEDWTSGMDGRAATPTWRRWARDCAKQGREWTMFCARAVDFKTQPRKQFAAHDGKPRVRLDCGFMPDDAAGSAGRGA